MSSQRWMPLVVLAVFGLTACPPPAEQPAEEQFPAPEEVPAEPMVQQEIAIVNESAEPITVRAMIDGRQENLGTVQPQDSASFTVSAQRGSSVSLEAVNPAGEVVASETVEVVEMRRDWRVSPGMQGQQPGQPTQPGIQGETEQPAQPQQPN